MSTLQELWYGNIRPNEDKVITDEEKKLVSLIEAQAFEIGFKLAVKLLTDKKIRCSLKIKVTPCFNIEYLYFVKAL